MYIKKVGKRILPTFFILKYDFYDILNDAKFIR